MKKLSTPILMLILTLILGKCSGNKDDSSESSKKTLWIYTSLYKDTIDDIKGKMDQAFPGVEVKWFQAGSEEIATKVNAEILTGDLQADILISSDRFWYEDLANNGKLLAFESPKEIDAQLKHPENLYSVLSLPVMVLCYNETSFKNGHPMSYKDLADPKWKDKVTTGSPLASGTNFTTVAMLQKQYGWEYFNKLKANGTIAQGGNSSVIRRIQSGERPIGWVLLENVLRLVNDDKRLKIVYPEDGAVIHANVLAVTKKTGDRDLAVSVAKWMFGPEGQDAMVRGFMYSPFPSHAAPVGAPPLEELLKKSFPWSQDFVKSVTENRESLKEKYTEIMFQ